MKTRLTYYYQQRYIVEVVVSSVLGRSRILGVRTFALQRRVDNFLGLISTGDRASVVEAIEHSTIYLDNEKELLVYKFERFVKFFMSQKLDLL